jgi:predicted secreted protein
MTTTQIVLIVVGGLLVVAVLAALVGHWLVRRGRRTPLLVRVINRTSGQVIDLIKQPITVAVLDEVADVLRTGHYTRNVATALRENRVQLEEMIAEKIKQDPMAGRIKLVPFHDRIISEVTEMTLRVTLEVLADQRTDELVSDLLRDNINQIRQAVREEKNEPPATSQRA